MIVLDTHAWVWSVSDPQKLGAAATRAIRSATAVGVPAVCCWELAMLISKGRVSVDRSPLEWMAQALARPRVELLPLTPAVAVQSTQLGHAFQGDPADRLIVATAILQGAPLVTRDARIRDYPAVQAVW